MPGEQIVPAAHVTQAASHERWQVVEVAAQHRTGLDTLSPVGQSVSTVQSCVGGVAQFVDVHAERTPAGSNVQ